MVLCCKYRLEKISLNLLDPDRVIDLKNLKTYLESQGPPYHQNVKDPKSKEYHYYCYDSSIFINELPKEAVIKIISPRIASSERVKSKIENILNRI